MQQELYLFLISLGDNKETKDFEYEGIFQERGGVASLTSSLRFYYQGCQLFTATREEILGVSNIAVLDWLEMKMFKTFNSEIFQLKGLEDELEEIEFEYLMKRERLERQERLGYRHPRSEKQLSKDIKSIEKQIEERTRKITELKKCSTEVQAIFLIRKLKSNTVD